jgi:crotonobetainyl-CoA:carnitine CoA-transferase CaiB-like acyl-CoA transferase
MFETLVEFNLAEHMGGLAFEPPEGPAGYARIVNGGRRPVKTADGHMAILPYSPAHWIALWKKLGREDVLARFDISDRHKLNAAVRALYAELSQEGPLHSTAQWMDICESLDVPATPVYTLDQLPDHPHLKAVGLFQQADHPSEGRIRFVRPAIRFERTPASVRLHAPLQGQDTAGVLGMLGYSDSDLADLQRRGVIRMAGSLPIDAGSSTGSAKP